jgi:cell division protein FtsW
VHACNPKFFSLIGISLVIAWLLLIITIFWGVKTNDASRWLSVFGIKFQPSEIAKLCLIVFTAFTLSKKKSKEDDKRIFLTILIATVITCVLIGIDNGSTAVLLFGIIFLMMLIGQISWKRMSLLAIVIVAFAALALSILKFTSDDTLRHSPLPRSETWKKRIFDPSTDINVNDSTFKINDKNFQEAHGYIAISNANFIGRGPGNSIERDFLPQAYSDFIYAIIIEETGLLGGIVVLLLYIILFIRAGVIANRSERLFPKYIVMGSALILVTQALANMAVAVGLIPVTGQTLPLVSRGGTSTLITCIYFGIILSVSRFDNQKGVKREEEIEQEFEEAVIANEAAI